ncbi:hypothetical protein [Rubritalea tangerina]|uniref:Uncharacterized protein n=1 Tax=Rubritalea tangerina TaxID=430798 RepID=A0ABW4ZFS3_9BACT
MGSCSLVVVAGSDAARFALNDGFIEKRSAAFAINTRAFDPFGLPQDPSREVEGDAVEEDSGDVDEGVEEPAIPAFDIELLNGRVSVMRSNLVVGVRYFEVGEVMEVLVGDQLYRLGVVSVDVHLVELKDMQSGEVSEIDPSESRKIEKARALFLKDVNSKSVIKL